jgi:hypothetical protein
MGTASLVLFFSGLIPLLLPQEPRITAEMKKPKARTNVRRQTPFCIYISNFGMKISLGDRSEYILTISGIQA